MDDNETMKIVLIVAIIVVVIWTQVVWANGHGWRRDMTKNITINSHNNNVMI